MRNSPSSLDQITTIIVNYKTADLTRQSVDSFLQWYPSASLILIDNGSQDDSTGYIAALAKRLENVTCILNQENRYHGPAMDQGIRVATTRYVFTLDSDCTVIKGGFLEEMHEMFGDPNLYATGRLVSMNRYGFEMETSDRKGLIPYVHPHAMLLHRNKYLGLKRFVHHGSPCLDNMRGARDHGHRVKRFPIEQSIFHLGRGTCSRYGYGLGPKTLLQDLLTRVERFVLGD